MKNLILILILFHFSFFYGQEVPEEAKRHYHRGQAALEMAQTSEDFDVAIAEFNEAAKLAPNWPDVFYALGQTHERAKKYNDAILSYKKYLELAPTAKNSEEVKANIYKLEFKAETENKKKLVLDGWASGAKEYGNRECKDGWCYGPSGTKEYYKLKDGVMMLDLLFYTEYGQYDQRNIPVQFDGKTLKWSYSGYNCLATPELSIYPCENKYSFTATVVSVQPLVLDVKEIWKSHVKNSSARESSYQMIFNK
jgi:tetratricopeptide (TPR) repeat protein